MAKKCFDEGPLSKLSGIELDDWFDDRLPRRNRAASSKSNTVSKPLKLASVGSETLLRLLEPSPAYARWLRVVLLRTLLDLPAVSQLNGRPSFNFLKIAEFIGFDDYERFSEGKTVSKVRSELKVVLDDWSCRGYN